MSLHMLIAAAIVGAGFWHILWRKRRDAAWQRAKWGSRRTRMTEEEILQQEERGGGVVIELKARNVTAR